MTFRTRRIRADADTKKQQNKSPFMLKGIARALGLITGITFHIPLSYAFAMLFLYQRRRGVGAYEKSLLIILYSVKCQPKFVLLQAKCIQRIP